MSLMKYFLRLQYIDFLIRRKATGDLQSFAAKNRISKRSLNYIIKEMKEMGFPIAYDKYRKSYCYKTEGRLVGQLFIEADQIVTDSMQREIGAIDAAALCFSEVTIFEPCETVA